MKDEEELPVATNGPEVEPSAVREAVERLAYQYWEDRGHAEGSATEDWFRAEAEINRRLREQ